MALCEREGSAIFFQLMSGSRDANVCLLKFLASGIPAPWLMCMGNGPKCECTKFFCNNSEIFLNLPV